MSNSLKAFIEECANGMDPNRFNGSLDESIDLFDDQHSDQRSLIEEFLDDRARGIKRYQWNLIDPDQYKAALRNLSEKGPELFNFSERIINDWLRLIIDNTIVIQNFTILDGRDELNGGQLKDYETVREMFPITYEKELKKLRKTKGMNSSWYYDVAAGNTLDIEGFYEWAKFPDGCDADSDNGVYNVRDLLEQIDWESSPVDKLVIINRCMDVFHQRSDWASAFIKGGRETLDEIRDDRWNLESYGPEKLDEDAGKDPDEGYDNWYNLSKLSDEKIYKIANTFLKKHIQYIVSHMGDNGDGKLIQTLRHSDYDDVREIDASTLVSESQLVEAVIDALPEQSEGMDIQKVLDDCVRNANKYLSYFTWDDTRGMGFEHRVSHD